MRMAFVFGISAVAIILILAFFGIPVVTKLAGYFMGLKSKPAIVNEDKTPPGPPFIKPLTAATNNVKLRVEGTSEPDATVIVFVNDESEETTANTNGEFNADITLTKGTNEIYAKAKDKAGNESVDSKHYSVYYSKEKPKLEVTKPSQGDNYYGDKQRQISVEGKTCIDCTLTVNGRLALVDDDGNFKLTYGLNNGSNDLNIIATDKAGNTEETTIAVNFTP